jgi:hypothetical protein
MSTNHCVITFLLCTARIFWAQQAEVVVQGGTFVPAGTLLSCTLDEPNFSSRTAQIGDPILCRTNSVMMFGKQVIPRGAYLSARLQAFRDPGHFLGKGWIQLEFTSLTLPGGNIPLDAKVISAGRYRVNGEGKIQGNGHATRDVVEWMIPILWPVKVVTLPARGPRPALKAETRIELRLMEDIVIPESIANSGIGGLPSRSSALSPKTDVTKASLSASRFGDVRPPGKVIPAQQLVDEVQPIERPQISRATQTDGVKPLLTLLILRGGRMYLVSDYWVDRGNLDYTTGIGEPQVLPLDALDLRMTKQLNAERGVTFILAAKTH